MNMLKLMSSYSGGPILTKEKIAIIQTESLKEQQKNNLETEIWKCVGRISLERHFLSSGFFPLASPSQFSDACKYMFVWRRRV